MKKDMRRQDALERGDIHFDGNPCKKCNGTKRYANTSRCVQCELAKNAAYLANRYRTDPTFVERKKKTASNWYFTHGKQDRKVNRYKYAASDKRWRENNRDRNVATCTRWRRNNLDKLAVNAANYRASKLQATPRWADKCKIQDWYTRAHELTILTGVPHTVDHVIPLNSEVVCGLHVDTNLQILTLSDNSAKGNTFTIL